MISPPFDELNEDVQVTDRRVLAQRLHQQQPDAGHGGQQDHDDHQQGDDDPRPPPCD